MILEVTDAKNAPKSHGILFGNQISLELRHSGMLGAAIRRFLEAWLREALHEFFEDRDEQSVALDLSSGRVTLENLRLRRSLLPTSALAIESGVIGRVQLDVPLTRLFSVDHARDGRPSTRREAAAEGSPTRGSWRARPCRHTPATVV